MEFRNESSEEGVWIASTNVQSKIILRANDYSQNASMMSVSRGFA